LDILVVEAVEDPLKHASNELNAFVMYAMKWTGVKEGNIGKFVPFVVQGFIVNGVNACMCIEFKILVVSLNGQWANQVDCYFFPKCHLHLPFR
jgi:hypothetical protein